MRTYVRVMMIKIEAVVEAVHVMKVLYKSSWS